MSTTFTFPQSLGEKYRPTRIADFIGIGAAQKSFDRVSKATYIGRLVGKSTMALALAKELQAELHKIPSQKCTASAIEEVVRHCWYAPMTPGGFHVVLADEADAMSNAAQLQLLSKLDSVDPAPNTIWIFTANDTERLERRFLSRCKMLDFSSYGMSAVIAAYLDKVWHAEGGGNGNAPDFARLAKESRNNVRDCLMRLDVELLAL